MACRHVENSLRIFYSNQLLKKQTKLPCSFLKPGLPMNIAGLLLQNDGKDHRQKERADCQRGPLVQSTAKAFLSSCRWQLPISRVCTLRRRSCWHSTCISSWVGWFDESLPPTPSAVSSTHDSRRDAIVLPLGSSKMWEEVGPSSDKLAVGTCASLF